MRTLKRAVVALLIGALVGISASGCNTFRGAGKDIQNGGKGIQNAADSVQGK